MASVPDFSHDMADEIHNYCVRTEREMRLRVLYANVASDHYNGRMWNFVNEWDYCTEIDENLYDSGLILNYSAGILDAIASTIFATSMTVEGKAVSSRPEDRRSAQMATAILQDHERRNFGNRTFRIAGIQAILTGNAFIRVAYDPSQLGTLCYYPDELVMFEKKTGLQAVGYSKLSDGKIRATYPLGGTTEHAVDANLVMVETGTQSFDRVQRFAVAEFMPISRAKALFPKRADLIEAMTINSKRSYGEMGISSNGLPGGIWAWNGMNQQTGFAFDPTAKMCRILEWWERTSNGTWQRLVMTGMRSEILLDEQTGWANHPYTCLTYKPVYDMFWGKGAYKDMARPQRVVNVIANTAMNHLTNSVHDVVFLPFNSKWEPSNDSTSIGWYDPDSPAMPIYKPVDTTQWHYLSDVKAQYLDDLQRLGQVSQIARGDVAPRISGRVVQQAIDVNSGPFLQVRADWVEAKQSVCRTVLQQAQLYYTLEREAPLAGERGEPDIAYFTGADVTLGTDVDVKETDKSAQAQADRFSYATELRQAGLFAPEANPDLQRIIDYSLGGTLESAKPKVEVDNQREAEEHFLWIVQGLVDMPQQAVVYPFGQPGQEQVDINSGQPQLQPQGAPGAPVMAPQGLVNTVTRRPLVNQFQDHQVHIAQNIEDWRRPGNSDRTLALLGQLIQEHQTILGQQQQAAQQAAYQDMELTARAKSAGQGANMILGKRLELAGPHPSEGDGGGGKKVSPNSPGEGGKTTARTDANDGKGKYAGKNAA